MRGEYQLTVRTNKVQVKLTIRRNLTIIQGKSATGKTTLLDSLRAYENLGAQSGITVNCAAPCRVIGGINWEAQLSRIDNSIVFVDDTQKFVRSHAFQHAARHSSNYYVIVARDELPQLPYSVDEIYGLKNTNRATTKYPVYTRTYTSTYRIYGDELYDGDLPEEVIVEDSNAGYEFFKVLCAKSGIRCVSAGGKSNIYETALSSPAQKLLVIADGAAFGREMPYVYSLRRFKKIELFLPESFEWLVLRSGLFNDAQTQDMLLHPADFIDCEKFFSWEQFFTKQLRELTRDSYLAYRKETLNPAYLQQHELNTIAGSLPKLGITSR